MSDNINSKLFIWCFLWYLLRSTIYLYKNKSKYDFMSFAYFVSMPFDISKGMKHFFIWKHRNEEEKAFLLHEQKELLQKQRCFIDEMALFHDLRHLFKKWDNPYLPSPTLTLSLTNLTFEYHIVTLWCEGVRVESPKNIFIVFCRERRIWCILK